VINQCSTCGSKRLVRGHLGTAGWRWLLRFYSPGGLFGLGKSGTDVRAAACADCGKVQLVGGDVEALVRLYKQQRADSLSLSEQS